MGSAKSRTRTAVDEDDFDHSSETRKTCCFAGIRKSFSKGKRCRGDGNNRCGIDSFHYDDYDDTNGDDDVDGDGDVHDDNDDDCGGVVIYDHGDGVGGGDGDDDDDDDEEKEEFMTEQKPMTQPQMAYGISSGDGIDDATLISNYSCHQSLVTLVRSAASLEPRSLHDSWSAPAVLGQDCHQFLMPPAESDVESVVSDIEQGNDDDGDADIESNDDVNTDSLISLVYYDSECDLYIVDNEAEIDNEDDVAESSDDETISLTDRTPLMAMEYHHVDVIDETITDEEDENTYSIYSPSGSEGDFDVTSDNGMTSQIFEVDVFIGKILAVFVTFLIWAFIRSSFSVIYQRGVQFIHDLVTVEEETAVVVHGETEDRTPQGHQNRYPGSILAYVRNAVHGVYQTGLRFVQDIMFREDGEVEREEEEEQEVEAEETEKDDEEGSEDEEDDDDTEEEESDNGDEHGRENDGMLERERRWRRRRRHIRRRRIRRIAVGCCEEEGGGGEG
ncbi:bromo and FHA domain-containing protein DDB_G0267958-like [Lytechinus pictus]|uniref:bromo and FHA domain-containing protein DDB_G0267958-like n=1 Tax=Lytechinus pictus TaxID=7653 RepID=UPI0030BA2512